MHSRGTMRRRRPRIRSSSNSGRMLIRILQLRSRRGRNTRRSAASSQDAGYSIEEHHRTTGGALPSAIIRTLFGGMLVRKAMLIAVLGFAALVMAQDQDFSKVQIKVTKVSGNIYMLEGAGGNIAASVGEDGIV